MRKDPPFDTEYVYTPTSSSVAELAGALVVNAPQALRDINEKAYTAWFPQLLPLTLVTRSIADMRAFVAEHGDIVRQAAGRDGRTLDLRRAAPATPTSTSSSRP